jgi:PAS domain S-box-containing protein
MYKNKLLQKVKKIDELEPASVREGRLVNAWRDLWAQYAAIIEAFDGLIYICSQDYQIEFMNQRFIDRTGYDAIGEKCYKALHDREEICPRCVNERVFQGETVRWEMRSPKDNHWYYMVSSPIRHSDGSISKMSMIQDITERKEMEEALRLAEADYRGIIENAVEGIFRSRPDGRMICVNPALAKIHGYDSPEEMVATIKDAEHQLYVDPGRRATFRRLMEKSGQVRGFEHRGYRKDHSQIWLSINARVVKDDRGAILYYEGFVEDITARKEAEEAILKAHDKLEDQVAARTRELARVNQELRLRLGQLERAEVALRDERQRLYSLLDGLPVDVHLVAPDHAIRFANRAFWEDFRGKSDGQPCYRLIHGREHPCEDCHAARVFETGIPQRFEDPLPNGKILQVSSYPFADIDGSPLVLVLAIDITEQRRAEEKLRESEGRFHQLIEQAADAIFLHDQGKIIEVNQRACDSLGYTREELLGMSIFDLEVDLAEDSIKKNWQPGNDSPRTIRGTHRRKDGTIFPVEVRAGKFEYGERRLRLNLVRDISERVQAERALKESEEKYRLLVNQIPAVVYQGYNDCTIDLFDRKVEELTGYPKEEFDSRKLKWGDLILREDLSEARRIFIEALKGDRSCVREYRIRRKDGEIRSIQDRGHIYCDDAGKVACIKGIFFDITDRQNAEKKLRESEQNLRHLASELLHAQERERIRIAHELHDDLGQSLLLLKLQLSTMARGLPVELQKPRQECVASIDNVQEIIDSVRRLSHDLIPPTLSEIGLKSAINVLLEEFCRHHDLDYSLDMDDLKGLFSPDRELNIYRIVQESLTNIGKYAQATQVFVSLKRKDHEVRLSVEDNGKGFEVDQILTHRDRKRGLGLASMEERARIMGGTFHLWSKPEKGTKMHINVPLIK